MFATPSNALDARQPADDLRHCRNRRRSLGAILRNRIATVNPLPLLVVGLLLLQVVAVAVRPHGDETGNGDNRPHGDGNPTFGDSILPLLPPQVNAAHLRYTEDLDDAQPEDDNEA